MTATAGPTRTFLLAYEVRPNQLLEQRDGIGGAFVNCWVVASTLEQARERAVTHLEATGWTKVAVIGEQAVRGEALSGDLRAYHDQAQADGEVYVIEVFPPEPPDA
jgi:hypothetical protein